MVFGPAGNRRTWGLGGPGDPKNHFKRWGANPPTFWKGFWRHPKIENRRCLAGPRNHVLKTQVCIPKIIRIQKVLCFLFLKTGIDIVGFGGRNGPLRPERQSTKTKRGPFGHQHHRFQVRLLKNKKWRTSGYR